MHDQPSTPDLLLAMASVLIDDVLPATSEDQKHHVRVIADLCSKIARESFGDAPDAEAIADAASIHQTHRDSAENIARELDRMIHSGEVEPHGALFEILLSYSTERVRISRPNYIEGEP